MKNAIMNAKAQPTANPNVPQSIRIANGVFVRVDVPPGSTLPTILNSDPIKKVAQHAVPDAAPLPAEIIGALGIMLTMNDIICWNQEIMASVIMSGLLRPRVVR